MNSEYQEIIKNMKLMLKHSKNNLFVSATLIRHHQTAYNLAKELHLHCIYLYKLYKYEFSLKPMNISDTKTQVLIR